jgi:hypothetical protein
MDHSEAKKEQAGLHKEKRLEKNRLRESNRAAEQRLQTILTKANGRSCGVANNLKERGSRTSEKNRLIDDQKITEKKLESRESKDKKVTTMNNYNADDIAELRRQEENDSKRGDRRFEELSRKKGLSGSEQQELRHRLKTSLEHTDPHWREADRRTEKGMQEFKENPKARRDFCHQAGVEEHKRWEKEELAKEKKLGRQQGEDFGIEAVHQHPDGKPVRLDKVDYDKDTITDRKPLGKNETEDQLIKKYEKQRQRHIEAYEHDTGRKVKEYDYSPYPSSKDIE